jgi:dephospho-CoA kinase
VIILGLTGSIGMGKTTAAGMLRRLGVPVHDADAEVHRLTGPGGAAVGAVEAAFPDTGVTVGGRRSIDRTRLRAHAFTEPGAIGRLEAILHPLVRRAEEGFLARAATRRAPLVVLDIPLLFETGGETRCDATLVVTAPRWIQLQRVLRRPGMTRARMAQLESRQMPDAQKRRRADFVVQTGLSKRATLRQLTRIVRILTRREPTEPCADA